MSKKDRPVIAVIGSVNPERNDHSHRWPYEPPLEHAEVAVTACGEIGAALAGSGWDVIVYAGSGTYNEEDGFVEPAVVRGYVSESSPDRTRSESSIRRPWRSRCSTGSRTS